MAHQADNPFFLDPSVRLAALVQSSDEAIYSTALDGIVTSWNAAAERIFGYAASEAIGRPVSFLLPEHHADEFAGIVKRLLRGHAIEPYETIRRRKDGETVELSLTISPIKDEAKRIVELSFIARDITERRRLEQEILEISEREQQRIGEDLHDGLCQELTGIAFMCQALEQKLAALSPAEAAEVAHVRSLINRCITETRDLVRGLHPPSTTGGDLASALRGLALHLEEFTPISCRFTGPRETAAIEPAVTLHLYRIAQETLQNAIRHGKATRVWIDLRTERGRLTLTISNDGISFPEAPTPRTGLGLRIMDHRANMIGASLTVQRGVRHGTVVTCSLRLPTQLPQEAPQLSTALIDDDQATSRHLDRG